MAHIKTDNEKEKIFRNDKNKIKEELEYKQKELGLRGMIPKNNQDLYQQLEDIKNEKNHIKEQMTQAKEERIKRTLQEKKAKEKTFNQKLKMYLAKREKIDKKEYEKRRLFYGDGEFKKYEKNIKMTPFRVLTKEIQEMENEGILLTENHFNKMSKYKVVCFGDNINDLEKNDIVLLEPYSGIEIVSGKEKYRIVYIEDVLIKLKE